MSDNFSTVAHMRFLSSVTALLGPSEKNTFYFLSMLKLAHVSIYNLGINYNYQSF